MLQVRVSKSNNYIDIEAQLPKVHSAYKSHSVPIARYKPIYARTPCKTPHALENQ